jgi:hypothetical protein
MKFTTHYLFVPLLFVALPSCVEKKSDASDQANTIHKTEQVVSGGSQKSLDRIHDLKTTMMDYMKLSNPSYTGEDVDACANILTQYVKELGQTHSKEEGLLVVKSAVFKLNKLNEKCGSELIETGEREVIAEIIIAASHEKGYNAADEDITEAWREW